MVDFEQVSGAWELIKCYKHLLLAFLHPLSANPTKWSNTLK